MGFGDLKRKIGLRILTHQVMKYSRDAQSGKLGPAWKARYEFWKGKKTWTGMALMVAGIAVAAYGPPEAAVWVSGAGALLASVGLVEKGYRTEIPAEVASSGWYRFLAQHGGLVAGILVTASAMVQGPADCTWCLFADKVIMVLGLSAAQVKLIDPAWRSLPPIRDVSDLYRYAEGDR